MKGYNGPSILCAVLLFGAVLVSPAFADMKKVDEAELARMNASVTGTPIKDINCVEKDGICQEMKQDMVTSYQRASVYSPSVSNTTESTNLNLNINGQTTFQFYFGGANSNMTGGITSVKPH
jgi:hypothetical protein